MSVTRMFQARHLSRLGCNRFGQSAGRRLEYRSSSTSGRLSYIHNVGQEPLMYRSIGQCLEESANKWPDRPWIVSAQEEKRLTFSDALEQADKLAAGLTELGMKPGDRLGLCCQNTTNWIVTMMAAARANLILVTINPVYQTKELEFCLKNVDVKCLVVPSEYKNQNYYKMLNDICPELARSRPGHLTSDALPALKMVVMADNKKLAGAFTFDEVMSVKEDSASFGYFGGLQKSVAADGPCNIQFTSGTTGKPKGACLSHFNFVNNSYMIGKRNLLWEKHHIILNQVPLFHAYGIVIVAMAALQHGSTIILPASSYNPEESIKNLVKEKCTVLTGTPTMYVDLLNVRKKMNIEVDSPEIAMIGGSPCSPQLYNQVKNDLKIKELKSIYGLTETSASVFQSLRDESPYQSTETVGHVQDHVEVKVVDTDGNMVPFGTPGELWVRGYNVMLGYWKNEEKTREALTSCKWLKTGDQFILQEDGYGKVVGRLKDVIIRGGENIYPREVEDYLNTHGDILESHVFGVKDERLGEEICAGVRLREGSKMDLETLRRYCQGNMANYKIPKHLRVIEVFPKTASGKIQKFRLREMFENGEI